MTLKAALDGDDSFRGHAVQPRLKIGRLVRGESRVSHEMHLGNHESSPKRRQVFMYVGERCMDDLLKDHATQVSCLDPKTVFERLPAEPVHLGNGFGCLIHLSPSTAKRPHSPTGGTPVSDTF